MFRRNKQGRQYELFTCWWRGHVLVGTDSSYNASALDHSRPGGRQGRYEWPNSLVEMMKLPKDQEEAILRGNAVKLFKL